MIYELRGAVEIVLPSLTPTPIDRWQALPHLNKLRLQLRAGKVRIYWYTLCLYALQFFVHLLEVFPKNRVEMGQLFLEASAEILQLFHLNSDFAIVLNYLFSYIASATLNPLNHFQ